MRAEWREEIVKRHDWKGREHDYWQPYSCSRCHNPDSQNGKSKFCPFCGCEMTNEDGSTDKIVAATVNAKFLIEREGIIR